MRFAEEIVAETFVPTWRGLLARALDARGLSQTDIARELGISQSAVSKHLTGRFAVDARLEREPRMRETVERVADGLAAGTMSSFEALAAAESLVRAFENRGPLCAIHEDEMPALRGLGCDLCIRASDSSLVAEHAVLSDLRAALRILETTPGLAALLPHVGSNVARALDAARGPEGVAAVPGRLFASGGAVKVPAPPAFGVSSHVAEVLLAAMRRDPLRRACMNLRPDAGLLDAAQAAGMRIAEVAPEVETDPRHLTLPGVVPDLFFHRGAFGIEPQAYLLASDASSLARQLQTLSSKSRGNNNPIQT